MPPGTEVGLGQGGIVSNRDASVPSKGYSTSNFSDRVYCDQTAGWINIPLDMEVDLGPSHILLDGRSSRSLGKGHSSYPSIRPMSIVAKRSPISATVELLCSL